MDDTSAHLIRSTWAKAAAAHTDTARLFYGRLFKIAPETRPLFQDDLRKQGLKLIATLGFVVDNLTEPETLVPAAEALAIRHLDYNVQKEHYAFVSEALLWTLEQLLAAEFTDEVKAAWSDALRDIEAIMVKAAYPEG